MNFICDVMLGKLAKYLRIAGIDTIYNLFFMQYHLFSIAADEHRIILTRRTEPIKSDSSSYYFVKSNDPHEQLHEVISHFNLHLYKSRFFTLCLLCNKSLQKIEKAAVRKIVPDYVFSTINDFSQCPCCKKIYWKGTHYNNMLHQLNVLLQGTEEKR